MYSEKILTCVGRLHICSQHNQYDPYWNFCWFQIRQLWKFLQFLIALIYENVILWPWQVTVHFFFNEYLVLRTSNSMLSLEAHQLAFFVLCFGSDIWLHVSGSGKRRGKEAIFFHLNLFHGFINICRVEITIVFIRIKFINLFLRWFSMMGSCHSFRLTSFILPSWIYGFFNILFRHHFWSWCLWIMYVKINCFQYYFP